MEEDQSSSSTPRQSWLGRLSQAFLAEPQDLTELVMVLRESYKNHLLDGDALTMIEGVLEVAEMQVRDIMIPRAQMVVVERDNTFQQILPIIIESAHSRFPVVGESRDEVIGILLAKDLLTYSLGGEEVPFNVRDILRPAVFIPESKRLNVLLREFRSSRNHMAIVVDEYGGIAGLVTIEDVLEQIVGEIIDEHDVEDDVYIMKHSDTNYTVKALIPIDDFNEYFGSNFSDEEFDTIGGLVMREFGHLPKRGETRDIGKYRFKVLHADSRRVHLFQLILRRSESNDESPSPSV